MQNLEINFPFHLLVFRWIRSSLRRFKTVVGITLETPSLVQQDIANLYRVQDNIDSGYIVSLLKKMHLSLKQEPRC